MTRQHQKLLAVTMTALMVFSMFTGTIFLSAPATAAGNTSETTTPRFEITDVGNSGGDLSVTVTAQSSTPVDDFRFWYDDLDGTSAGPAELGDGKFSEAYYGIPSQKGPAYSPGSPISGTTRVTFEFHSSGTDFDYESDAFRLNATAYDADYATADTGNRSVITGNYYQFSMQDDDGNPIPSGPLMFYDAETNESRGFGFVSGGSTAYDCLGVDVDGTCTNADTGADSSITDGRQTYSAPVSVEAFDLSTANSSGKVDPSMGATTLTTDTPTAPTFLRLSSLTGGPSPQADSITITNATSGNVVYQSDLQRESGAPVFLRPNTEYTVAITNSSSFGTERRLLTLPTKGMSSAQFRVATTNVDTSPVTGQIVDENGNPVSDAVVIAQKQRSSGSQLDIYNSTTTDGNGLFTMELPETSQLSSKFGFRIVGTDTSGGTPIHYPTTDANDGNGYVVQSGSTVIPAMTIQQGGRVDVTITNETGKLSVEDGFTSLSQVSTAYPDTERTANSNSFSTFSFGETLPASAAVSLMSPTTGSDTQVTYNIWGLGGQSPDIQYLCAGTPDVSQGQSTDSACTLDRAGYLNISVQQYGSIIDQQSSSYARIDGGQFSSFFYENELVVRDASSGDVITYLGPDGSQQLFLGTDANPNDISVPVPPGNYEVKLRPSYESAPYTTVNDTSTVSVSSQSTTDVTLDRGSAFEIRPAYRRSQQSFNRGADNTVAVRIRDPAGSMLTDSDVSAEAFLQNPDGTTASSPVALSYNSSDGTFETKTFNPSTLGVDAGRYTLAVRATYTDGDRTYNSTFSRQVQVSGFQTAIQLGSRTVAPGDSILGRIYAYDTTTDPDTAIDASSASQTTITVYDQNGRQVSQTNPANGITSGQGSFSLTMPDDPGRYRIAVRVQSDQGSQGIAERWVRVDQVDLDVDTDRRTYSPTDTVSVDVTATDATDGSAIQDASLTLRINDQRVSASTGNDGQATIRLDPKQYASNRQQWKQGQGISVTLAAETGNSVVRKTAGTGFEVQAFDARARPTAEAFSASESSVLEVRVPTSVTVTSVAVTELDGEGTRIGGSLPNGKVTNPASGIYRIDLGQRSIGEHIATVSVTTKNRGSQTARTQFAVQQYSLSASLAKRTYDTGESIALDVSVRNPDGSVVTNQQVDAALNTTGPVRTVDSASASTGSNGDASLSLSSSQSGFHFIEVSVGQQTRYVGLSISSVSARLEDGNGNPVSEYNAEPGSSQTVYVNATKAGGTDVADGSTVRAFISSYGDTIELGSAETTNGDASIAFQIPSSVPAREYPLIVDVTTQSGSGFTTGTLNVTGANAKQITTTTNESAYSPDDTARLSATVTTGDGSPIANEPVDFVLESEGSADQRLATVQTDADGEATVDYAIPSDASNGEYVVRAALNDTGSIRAYTGYRVRSLDVAVTAADGPFEPGDTVDLTVFANDSVTGAPVDATGGTVELVLSGSNVQTSIDTTGTGPYETSITLPDDGSITGTRSLSVTVQQDRATDTDSTLIEVRDSSESANLSIAEPVTAGQATTVTVNGTVDTTAVLTAYSPGAGSVAFNGSVAVSSTSDTTTQLTIDSPGTHIVRLSVPGVGALTQVVDVQAAGGNPVVWTRNATGVNTTQFSGTEDIHIRTNEPGMTATVISQNATYTVELDQQSGDDYYGVLSANRADGVYLVRLDSETATSVNDTIVEVGE